MFSAGQAGPIRGGRIGLTTQQMMFLHFILVYQVLLLSCETNEVFHKVSVKK